MLRSAARPIALVAAVIIAACAAGCGGAPERPSSRARTHASAPGPCRAVVRAAVARASASAAAGVRTRTTDISPGQATCVYETRGLRVDVRVDTNPQADFRFSRAVVERDQVALWSHRRRRAPRLVQGIGQGADWFPAEREMLTTDGRKLVSVIVVRAALAPRARYRLGRTVAGLMVAPAR